MTETSPSPSPRSQPAGLSVSAALAGGQAGAAAALAGRLLLAALFIIEGWAKLTNIKGTMAYMEAFGVPGVLVAGAIVVELGGGLAVAAGVLTRWAALALAGFCIVVALIFHWMPRDPEQMLQLWKDLAIGGGFLLLAVHGPGPWSIGRLWSGRPR